MKIALLTRRVAAEHGGGLEAHARWLAGVLTERGHRVTVVTTADGAAPAAGVAAGVDVLTVEAPPFCWSRAWFQGTADAVAQLGPDLIVAESTAAGHLANTIPTVTHLHGNHVNELEGTWATWGRRRTRRALRGTARAAGDYLRWRPRRARAGYVVALSRREARMARCLYGAVPERIAIIGNPVGARFLAARTTTKELRIVFTGRLDTSKGPDLALRAFAASTALRAGYTFELAGDGPLREELAAQTAALGLRARVRFHGRLDQTELAALLGRASIACFPSVGPEAFSIALLEAMATGCAIVASPAARLDAIAEHPMVTATGAPVGVVRERDVRAWSNAFDMLVGDAATRQRFGAAAAEVARSFSAPRIADAFEALYAHATGN